jgi:hypothetical protein
MMFIDFDGQGIDLELGRVIGQRRAKHGPACEKRWIKGRIQGLTARLAESIAACKRGLHSAAE